MRVEEKRKKKQSESEKIGVREEEEDHRDCGFSGHRRLEIAPPPSTTSSQSGAGSVYKRKQRGDSDGGCALRIPNSTDCVLMSNLNSSNSNLPDSAGRFSPASFSAQSPIAPGFHHTGSIQGLHGIQGNFSLPNMAGSLGSRNSALGNVTSSGLQQAGGGIPNARYASNNLSLAMSQLAHGHSGATSRGGINVGGAAFSGSINGIGGSIPGINPSSGMISNRSSVPSLGVSPILGNAGPRIAGSMGSIVGSNVGRAMSSGGLTVPGLASRGGSTVNSVSNNLSIQGTGRLKSGVLQQAPQMIGMLGSSYPGSGGPLSQSQVQAGNNPLSSMGMFNDVNANDNSPFDMNDFPLLGRPSSAGGPQGQMVSLRKQGVGVNSIVQQSQEFSIQNEDFPALPGFKGNSSDYTMDLHQKDQLHENVSMIQSQHFPMARSAGFSLTGAYSSHRQQQQQHTPSFNVVDYTSASNQDLHLHGSEMFPSSHGSYHSQSSGQPSIGLRPLNSPSSNEEVYNRLIQQYQQHPQNQSQFRLQQMSAVGQSYRDQSLKSLQGSQPAPDRFGLMGLLSVIRISDQDLASLALGIDLTTLGLNLNSQDTLYKTFGSPWSDEPAKGEPEFNVPACYSAKPPPALHPGYFQRFSDNILFYIFYSMPKDEAQLYAAHALCMRGWSYHKELRMWMSRLPEMELLAKSHTYERGDYNCFDPSKWQIIRKNNFVLHYEMLEKRPTLPSHS